MKKLITLLLTLLMLFSAAACGSESKNTGTTAGKSAGTTQDAQASEASDNPYAKLDTSKPVEISMTVLGNKPNDLEMVLGKANELIKAKVNSTLALNFIALSDFATKYQLTLAGGEDLDLVYAANWAYFQDEVRKGAFKELTEEFRNTYMPVTMKEEDPVAWKQVAINGKVYAVPRNESDFDVSYGVVLRGELRKKYNIEPLKSLADYENFLLTVAANEKSGIFAFNLFPSFPVLSVLFQQVNNLFSPTSAYPYVWDYDSGDFKTENVQFMFDMQEYTEYAMRMAKWAKAGVWPSNAITSTTHTNDLFKEEKSASNLAHYKSAASIIKDMENKGITDVEYYNIFDSNIVTQRSPYSFDCCAIAASSKQPERAAITLDVIKHDRDVNLLLVGGEEGTHYVINSDGSHSSGPKAADYTWDSWTWCIRNNWNPPMGGMTDNVKAVRASFEKILMDNDKWPCFGFIFDVSSVKAEWAVVNSIINEYKYSFDLGVFGDDTQKYLDKMRGELKQAGLEKITKEYLAQLGEFTGK